MLALVQFFFELCLLRKAPQDLPASWALFNLTLIADLLAGVMLAVMVGLSPVTGLSRGLVDVALMLALLYGALYLVEHGPRFRQSATALLGSGALLGLFAEIPLGLLSPVEEGRETGSAAALLFLLLIVWNILVTGHILRHTFALRLAQGVGIAILYYFFAYVLLGGLFSGT